MRSGKWWNRSVQNIKSSKILLKAEKENGKNPVNMRVWQAWKKYLIFLKKVLTSQNDYGNLLWLLQRALLFEKNFLKKFLTKPRRYDNLSWMSKNSRTLIIEQWNTWIENSFTFIPASNEQGRHVHMSIRRVPQGLDVHIQLTVQRTKNSKRDG